MIVFNSDLDNTVIFSYKKDIGSNKRNVEIYQEREISFVTTRTYELLKEIQKRVLFVPTTTRTTEQYNRIDLGIEKVKYALTCNGGVLLIDGIEDKAWYEKSLELVSDSLSELKKAQAFLEKEARRTFEVRFIKELFVFTKCDEPENVVKALMKILDHSKVSVMNNGTKVYVVPLNLSKGIALQRFKQYIGADKTIAAGDSAFDVSMLREADLALAPKALMKDYTFEAHVVGMDETCLFSESMLSHILDRLDAMSLVD